jgi:hypothetical protein
MAKDTQTPDTPANAAGAADPAQAPQFGIALLVAALVSTVFNFTQQIAALRKRWREWITRAGLNIEAEDFIPEADSGHQLFWARRPR